MIVVLEEAQRMRTFLSKEALVLSSHTATGERLKIKSERLLTTSFRFSHLDLTIIDDPLPFVSTPIEYSAHCNLH